MKIMDIVVLIGAALTTAVTHAEPITYSGFTIADGKLGAWEFHNARIYLTLESDTNNVQLLQIPVPGHGTADVALNAKGTARVIVVSNGKKVRATFAPNQIFVSVDLGSPDANTPPGRGVGFGSQWPSGPNPTYPLGIEDGTIDSGDASDNGAILSDELATLPTDLKHSTSFSGRAWICLDFLDNRDCAHPADPLKTDKGDFFLYQKYRTSGFGDALMGGTFSAVTHGSNRPGE